MKNQMICLCSIVLAAGFLFAQDDYYEEKLTYDEGSEFGQMFGVSTVTNGEDLIITSTSGVHCYSHNNTYWVEYQLIEEPVPLSFFGTYLQIEGNMLFISADGEEYGKIYIYNKIDGIWIEESVIEPEDPDAYDFGADFYFADDLALIRANAGDAEENSFGVVFIYQYDGETWSEIQRIDGDDSGFGSGLHIRDDLLLIGDTSYSQYYSQSGAIHCYQESNDNWEEVYLLTPSLPAQGGGFGRFITSSDEFIFIGASGGVLFHQNLDYPGLVYVYRYENNVFTEVDILSTSDAEGLDRFGNDIEVNDSTLVISAYNNDDAGSTSGSAYIFKQNENDHWVEFKKICPSNMARGDFFGWATAITDDYVFVSSPMKDNMTGAVYVFDPHDNSLHANFAGDVRNGNAPVTVQFTSIPQGNPTAFEWDFNSDGFIESTEPNPQFTYYINGVYTVTLTVYDETGSDSEVKTDYIQVVSDILFGDVNGDGTLDVGDLVVYIDFVLGYSEPEEEQFLAGDVNYSGQIDIIDIVMVIDEILE